MKLLWLQKITCNGNAHSFLNYPNLIEWMEDFEWVYHPLLPSTYSLKEIQSDIKECDILMIEGAIDREDSLFLELFKRYANEAKYILTLGTCATFGGIFAQAKDSIKGLHFDKENRLDEFGKFWQKSISLPGCPLQPQVLAGVLNAIKEGISIPLDKMHRPKYYYAYTVHNGCTRNEYFEYKIDEHRFGELEGCMFYEHGCQGTYTHNSCNKILWNSVNSKTRAGQPCMGCSEPNFPDDDLWRTKKNMGIPAKLPSGVPKRAYLSLAGVAKAFKIDRFYHPLMEDESE